MKDFTILTEQVYRHTHLNTKLKSRKWEFRVLPNQTTRFDIEYIPLLNPRIDDNPPLEVIEAFIRILTTSIANITNIKDEHQSILIDTFVKGINIKWYHTWQKDIPKGNYFSSAEGELLSKVLLAYNPKLTCYQQMSENETFAAKVAYNNKLDKKHSTTNQI